MANKKISEMTALTTPDVADIFPIVDVSVPETKKITYANLKTALSDSPVLVTPALGTPVSGTITNCTGSPSLTNLTVATLHNTGTKLISATLNAEPLDIGAAGDVQLVSTGVVDAIGVAVATDTYKWAQLLSSAIPTGTGDMVLSNSPTLVTPTLGEATATSLATSKLVATNDTAPVEADSAGTKGEIRVTTNYIYVCIATNTWKRVAIATWGV